MAKQIERTALSDKGGEAQGAALAAQAFTEAGRQATTWARYLYGNENTVGLVSLSQAGRAAFRKEMSAQQKATRKMLKGQDKNNPEVQHLRRAMSSGYVRLSQLVFASKAIDAGIALPTMPDGSPVGFDRAITGLRMAFVATASAKGPTQRKGRPSKTVLEKFQKYVAGIAAEHRGECLAWFAKNEKAAK